MKNRNEFEDDLDGYISEDSEENVSGELNADGEKSFKHSTSFKVMKTIRIVCYTLIAIAALSFLPKFIKGVIIGVNKVIENQNYKEDQAGKPNDNAITPTAPQLAERNPEYTIVSNYIRVGQTKYYGPALQCVSIIKNTGNTYLYLNSSQFDIEDDKGTLLYTKSYISGYPQIIAPGEQAVYYEYFYSEDIDASKTYVLNPHLDVEYYSQSPIRLDSSDISFTDDGDDIKILGRITNNTSVEYSNCDIIIILLNSEKSIIGIETTDGSYKPGETKGFTATYDSYWGETADDVKYYIVYAYPYKYNW